MGLLHACEALAGQWEDITARLSGDKNAELVSLIKAFTTEFYDRHDREEAAETLLDIADLLHDQLPRDHPWQEALRSPQLRVPVPEHTYRERIAEPLRALTHRSELSG